jgi:hypothetical protein
MDPGIGPCKPKPFLFGWIKLDHKEPIYERHIHLIDVIDVPITIDSGDDPPFFRKRTHIQTMVKSEFKRTLLDFTRSPINFIKEQYPCW